GLLAQHLLVEARRAEPLAARAFEEMQVARMIDDAAGVGVLPVDPDRDREWGTGHRGSRPPGHSLLPPAGSSNRSAAPSRRGGAKPKWRQQRAVTIRPRAVRT